MKTLLLSACCLVSVSSAFALDIHKHNFLDEVEKSSLTDNQKDEILSAFGQYEIAEERLSQLISLNGIWKNISKPKRPTISGDLTDPTIKAILKQVQKTHNRFETMKRTINKWGPSTNLTARAAGASFQDKLNNERDVSKWTRKLWKAKLKAVKKDQKNYEKWVKDTEKSRDKSSEDLAEFFQSVLDQAAAAREDAVQ